METAKIVLVDLYRGRDMGWHLSGSTLIFESLRAPSSTVLDSHIHVRQYRVFSSIEGNSQACYVRDLG